MLLYKMLQFGGGDKQVGESIVADFEARYRADACGSGPAQVFGNLNGFYFDVRLLSSDFFQLVRDIKTARAEHGLVKFYLQHGAVFLAFNE